MLTFALYVPCKDLAFVLYLERKKKKTHNVAEKCCYVKPSLTTSAHCCQGLCTEICLAGSLMLLTGRCVIPTAQLGFWWLNWCSKAHSGGFIRELYFSSICINREKLKYIQAYSPFCMTQIFSLALPDLLIFNSLIWGLVCFFFLQLVLVHILNSQDQLSSWGKTNLQLYLHEGPSFKASLEIFTSTAIKDSCKSKSVQLPRRRFSLKEGNWSAAENGDSSVQQMQGGTLRMAAGLGGSMRCIRRPPADFLTWLFYIGIWCYYQSNIGRWWISPKKP